MKARFLTIAAATLASSAVASAQEVGSTPPSEAAAPPAEAAPAVTPAEPAAVAEPAPEPEPEPEAVAMESRGTTLETTEPKEPPMLAFGPHVGVLIPQLFGELGAWPIFGIELGYILPFDVSDSMRRPLQLTFDVLYTQPGAKGTEDAPALGEDGQTFDWELKERILVLELGGIWRFMTPGDGLSPFAMLGGRLYLMESIMTATSAGADFGENRETKMQGGFVVGGGAEYALGPGSLFGALEIGWSDLKQRVTGDSNTGALVIDLGYRFMF